MLYDILQTYYLTVGALIIDLVTEINGLRKGNKMFSVDCETEGLDIMPAGAKEMFGGSIQF